MKHEKFTKTELINLEIVEELFVQLNKLNIKALGDFFSDDALLDSLNDRPISTRPIEGKDAILDYLKLFFTTVYNIEYELLCTPFPMRNIVTVKHCDHFELNGVLGETPYVSVFVFKDQEIKKWLTLIE